MPDKNKSNKKEYKGYYSHEFVISFDVLCYKNDCDTKMEVLHVSYSKPSVYTFKCHECMNEVIISVENE